MIEAAIMLRSIDILTLTLNIEKTMMIIEGTRTIKFVLKNFSISVSILLPTKLKGWLMEISAYRINDNENGKTYDFNIFRILV